MRLSGKVLEQLSVSIAQLYVPTSRDNLPNTFIQCINRIIGSDQTSYNEFGPNFYTANIQPEVEGRLISVFASLVDEHPSIRHIRATRTNQAVKISDFLTAEQWRKKPLYNEFFREIGIEHQLGLMFQAGPIQLGYAVNRTRRDFSEEERLLFNMLQPHLKQSYENAVVYERIHRASDLGPSGTALFSGSGKLLHCSEKAREGFEQFFPGLTGESLPDPILRWVRSILSHDASLGLPVLRPFVVEQAEATLTVRLFPHTAFDEHALTVEVEEKGFPLEVFRKHGHSRREAEVLHWVSQGKSNQEIAILLGISPRTVAHHVERILARIGTENRGGASAWVNEVLRTSKWGR